MCGVLQPRNPLGNGNTFKYYISFTDDCTRFVNVLFLPDKSQAFDQIKERLAQIKHQFGKVPKWIRFDNGKELVNEKLKKLAAEEGIIIETTAPYSPSQNGVAERFNRTLLELARAMLIAKNLPTFLWDELMKQWHMQHIYEIGHQQKP
jgi:transposase InsO family protein